MTISTEALKYSAAGSELHGHLAYDDAISGVRPGVLIIHEWWGLNDYMRERAAQIAALGYVALAVDMYGEGKIGSSPDEAGVYRQLSMPWGIMRWSIMPVLVPWVIALAEPWYCIWHVLACHYERL